MHERLPHANWAQSSKAAEPGGQSAAAAPHQSTSTRPLAAGLAPNTSAMPSGQYTRMKRVEGSSEGMTCAVWGAAGRGGALGGGSSESDRGAGGAAAAGTATDSLACQRHRTRRQRLAQGRAREHPPFGTSTRHPKDQAQH